MVILRDEVPGVVIPSPTVGEALFEAGRAFSEAGIDDSRSDAMLLLMFAAGSRREALILENDRPLTAREQLIFDKAVSLRLLRRPLAYIVGERWFYGRPFKVNRAVLIPRPETELLVDFAKEKANESAGPLTFADIGTGSGCIAVSVAAEIPDSSIVAVDLSPQALLIAKKNAARHGVTERISFFEGDLTGPLSDRSFNVILSNPPYIPPGELQGLMPEVSQYEPEMALSLGAGEDGTELHRRLIVESRSKLIPGGWIALEVGDTQANIVCLFAEQCGYKSVQKLRDLSGIDRVVVARRSQ